MRFLIFLSTIISLAGCETIETIMSEYNYASGQTRYVCSTYDSHNYPSRHVLTLPIPPDNSNFTPVDVWFQGNIINAVYRRKGLAQFWVFDDDLYVRVDADNDAQYWDFQGADEGEKRKPQSVFKCKKLS